MQFPFQNSRFFVWLARRHAEIRTAFAADCDAARLWLASAGEWLATARDVVCAAWADVPALPGWAGYAVFPLVLLYDEAVFKVSVGGQFTLLSTALIALFGAAYGWLAYLLAGLPRQEHVRRALAAALLALLALPFLVEYFVYRAFHVFYDLSTVFGGAQDAVGGFGGDILHLLFSADGLLHIVLYLLPCALYLLLGARIHAPHTDARALRRVLPAALCTYAAALAVVCLNPLPRRLYRQGYSFQTAVGQFGLMSALRLDAGEVLFGRPIAFEPESTPAPVRSEATPAPTAKVYAPNSLEIDFAALAATASGTEAELDAYVASLSPTLQNEYTGLFAGKNLIFITAEAFCAEAINPDLTPTLYRLAERGIRFTDYYQPASAGTTGGECSNLLGVLPMLGGMSMKQAANHALPLTMGHQLDALGYYGMAFHNNDYTYYSRNVTHNALGYSEGFMGYGNGMEAYVKKQWPQSDLEMIEGTLPLYLDHTPFNVYYMSVSGHSPYTLNGNAMSAKHLEQVAALPYSDTVRAYLAANLELEDAMAYLVNALEKAGLADDTVICLTPDHFPYGLDIDSVALGKMKYLEELYGAPVNDYLYRDHSCLLLWSGCLEDRAPITVSEPVSSLDILPTLSNLFGLAYDSRLLPGRDVFSGAEALVFDTSQDWKTALGTYIADTGVFTPATPDTAVPEGYIERISRTVSNKLRYCQGVLETDYFAHVLPGTVPAA